jgi:hypothetical protein
MGRSKTLTFCWKTLVSSDERGARLNATDREMLIRDLLADEFSNPVRIVAFNTVEGWSVM